MLPELQPAGESLGGGVGDSEFSHLRVRKLKHFIYKSCQLWVEDCWENLNFVALSACCPGGKNGLYASGLGIWVAATKILLDIQNNTAVFFSKVWHFYH